MTRSPRGQLLLALAIVAAHVTAASGQQAYSPAPVPASHWSVDALRRLAGLGLLPPGMDAARRAPTQAETGAALEFAAAEARPGSVGSRLAAGYRDRFEREFADVSLGELPRALAGSNIVAGWSEQASRLETGWGFLDGHPYGAWNQGAYDADRGQLAGVATLQAGWPRAAFRASATTWDGDPALRELQAVGRFGPVAAWVGRRSMGWAIGAEHGLVVNDAAFDGLGVQTVEPFRLPWVLSHIGAMNVDLSVARRDLRHPCVDPTYGGERVPCEDAWFIATRGSVTPHPRLALGVTRAAVFGGEGNTDVDAFSVFSVLIGKHAGEVSELDNQVVSLDAVYRPPTERWLPLRAYVEWGFEDSAGAWKNVPGILAGIEVPALPGMPMLAAAVERVSFAESCCGNPMWYRHSVFHDGWTVDGRPLGHPLGGHGTEWAVALAFDRPESGLHVGARLFDRERGHENLYAELREGSSVGTAVEWRVPLTAGLELRGELELERGDGWREHELSVGLQGYL